MLSDFDKKFLAGMNIKADRDIAPKARPARRAPESLLHDPRMGPSRMATRQEYLRLLQDYRKTGLDYMVTLSSGERISAYQLDLRAALEENDFVCSNVLGRAYAGSDDQKIYNLATHNGCNPFWAEGMLGWAWHCGCTDDLHCADQQCSAITFKSARRRRRAK